MKSAIMKFRIKQTIISLLYLSIVILFAYINNKVIETLIYILTYSIIRNEFTKAVHGSDFTNSAYKGIVYCRIITFIVQIISVIFILTINISKYINLLLAFILGILNFLSKDYLEHKMKSVIFYKGMKEVEIPNDLKGIEYDVIFKYYVKREKLEKIALELNYSIDNVKKIKSKIIKKYT